MIRQTPAGPVFIAVPSYQRPQNVQKMHELLGGEVTWVVRQDEEEAYRAKGATDFLYQTDLITARNAILAIGQTLNVPTLQSDDDLKGFKKIHMDGKTRPATAEEVYTEMLRVGQETGAKLIGVPPTSNPFYGSQKVNTTGFIIASLMLTFPTDLRFDDGYKVKEDYDFTLQHLATYGAVARCDWLLAEYQHYTNAGGVVATRTDQSEAEAVTRLKEKWGPVIKDNPKHENEVLIKWDAEKYHAHKRKNRVWKV